MNTEIKLMDTPWHENAYGTSTEQEFSQMRGEHTTIITTDSNASVYTEDGLCNGKKNLCIESPPDKEVNIFFKGSGNVKMITGDPYGNELSELLSQNNQGIKLSGDWTQNPKTISQMNIAGKSCTQTFDPNAKQPMTETCN